jgi:hypothetical protein
LSETPPNGTVSYRVGALERRLDRMEAPGPIDRRLDRLESFEPAVMRRELSDVEDDIHQMSKDFAALRRLFMGFVITFCVTSVSIVVLIFTNLAHAKP